MLQGARRYSLQIGEMPPWFVRAFVCVGILVCGFMAMGAAAAGDIVGVVGMAGMGAYIAWCISGWAHCLSDRERNFVELGESSLRVTINWIFPVRTLGTDFPYSSIARIEMVQKHDLSPFPRWPLELAWTDSDRTHIDIHLKKARWMPLRGGLNPVAVRVLHIEVPDAEEFASELRDRLRL